MIDNIHDLVSVVTGYQRAAVVTAGSRLGVFDELTEPTPCSALAAKLGVSEDGLRRLLNALVHLGLIEENESGYQCSELAARELGSGSDMALVIEKEAFFAGQWLHLDQVVRTGKPALATWEERLAGSDDQPRFFLRALDALARRIGAPLADMEVLAPAKKVLDVGGGLGSYSRMITEAGSKVTMVERPQVIRWAREHQGAAGEAIEMVDADALAHQSCGGRSDYYDAVLVSHLVHDLGADDAVKLLTNARRACRSGGVVMVNDFAGDSGPEDFGPLFDLMMAVETGGRAYKMADLKNMMEKAGLSDVKVADLPQPLTVLIGSVA